MPRFHLLLIGALLLTRSHSTFAADEDLFSEIRTNLVFDHVTPDRTAGAGSIRSARRITDAEALRDLLKVVGFEAKVGGDRSVVTQKQLGKWTFPVLVLLSDDETTVNIVLGLSTIKDVSKELTSETLLKFMTASQNHAPAIFSYHSRRQRTELSVVVKNQDLTGQSLRDEINRLAVIARDNEVMWDNSQAADKAKPTAPAPAAPAPTTTPTQTTPTQTDSEKLTGRWSAARSDKEAFAVEFTAGGTFKLVYINDGQQTRSSGTFRVAEELLTLTGTDGLKLQGKLTVRSDSEFRFQPKDATELVFARAK
ncbi:MAG: hypothetical protein R3C59_05740 [Planctomycetaceae bacterium]